MCRLGDIRCADHDEPIAGAQHEDRRAVQLGQRLEVSTSSGAPRVNRPPEVQDAVDRPQHRVDVVGDQQHARAARTPVVVDELDDGLLVGEIEAGERFVAEEQRGIVGERLADAQALLLSARQQAHRTVGERTRAHGVDERVDARTIAAPRQRQAEPVAVDTERDDVAAPQRRLARQRTLLRM
jgi:hypothetical protein